LNEGGIQKTGVLSILVFCFLLEEYECAADSITVVHFTFTTATFIVKTESDAQKDRKLLH
jgi:hypothetical protein